MRVTVTAFNAAGYQKEILVMSEMQIHMHDGAINTCSMDIVKAGNRMGIGAAIDPSEFPEMVRFVVKIIP